ncbi:MAG: hypothetical protein PHP51_05680 [Desulfotomaculaceae bacterium]|nr:hypothetical protein [Desulfotomaculaceae bacterium]MDD4767655.1 hypothetical protein [Desulfotomaculaceae bacterium]
MEQKLDVKIPCPNCGSKAFGIMNEPYCIMPSLVKSENSGYEIDPERGLAVMPVICNVCGYVLFFHPLPEKNKLS